MRTLKSLIAERKDLLTKDLSELPKWEAARTRKKIKLLDICIRYADTKPSEEFVRNEITRLNKRVELIRSSFTGYVSTGNYKNDKELRRFYNKEMGLSRITEQLKTLKFLATD